MKWAKLDDKYKGQTIYIIGTGPSLKMFPTDFFQDKVTIGLNFAYKHFRPTYTLTIHPELLPRTTAGRQACGICITKLKDWLGQYQGCQCLEQEFYLLRNNTDVHDFSYVTNPTAHRGSNRLYVGRGIHTAAMHLAARLGASYAILIGVDMSSLLSEHHAVDQHIQFHGLSQNQVYQEYYECAAKLRSLLVASFHMQTLSMSPFLGLDAERDYITLRKQYGFPAMPGLPPEDISTYQRTTTDKFL